jgi:hypothetical protein
MSSTHSSTYSARITPDLLKLIDETVRIATINPPAYDWINNELHQAQQRAMAEFSRLQGWTLRAYPNNGYIIKHEQTTLS